MADFITITKNIGTGILGALGRAIVIVSREAVAGVTIDPETGLYKINDSDVATFLTNNTASPALSNAMTTLFSQIYIPSFVYILSSPSGVTSIQLDTANRNVRAWSFITLVSELQGSTTDEATYFADLLVIGSWLNSNTDKIGAHTYSTEESGGSITLPTALATDGAIVSNNNMKTIVSNSNHDPDPYTKLYDNIALAWMGYNLYGSAISRSWGSLSDSHDYAFVSSDNYTTSVRSQILNANLGQYNGARDRAGSLFVYDTLMNDNTVPPDSLQIESLAAINYITDAAYVAVHNALQAAGEEGVPNDDSGISRILNLTDNSLKDSFDLNLILATASNTADYIISALTAKQVTALSPNWQTTGVWPSGVIKAKIRPFSATHYITINFTF